MPKVKKPDDVVVLTGKMLDVLSSLRPRGDAVEVRTSVLSGETNSETQPWVALALVRHSGAW